MAKPKRTQPKTPKNTPQIPTSLPADLPAPSTCRNLLPRSRTASLARSGSGSLPGSRGSSRRSSISLANAQSRPATPADAGGTISLESGNATDPGQPVAGPSGTPQSGKIKESSHSADLSSEPLLTTRSDETRTVEQGSMDFTQGNGYYGWPQHLDEDMLLHSSASGRHPGGNEGSSSGSYYTPSMSAMQSGYSMSAERGQWAHYPDGGATAGGSSSAFNYRNDTNFHQYSTPMGAMNYAADNRHFTSWSNPSDDSWNINNYPSSQNNWTSTLAPSQTYHTVSADEYNLAMGRGSKRKRSSREDAEQGVAGGSSGTVDPSQGNDESETFSSSRDDITEADEVEQALVSEIKPDDSISIQEKETVDRKGKGKARAQTPLEHATSGTASQPASSQVSGPTNSTMSGQNTNTVKPKAVNDPLSTYTCPICFSEPTNATITPCGHICCGECLFAAVKTSLQRSGHVALGARNAPEARCPVCRSVIPGWDGKGGGVIGLKIRAVFSL